LIGHAAGGRLRVPELDGLRGIAVVLVLAWHLLPPALAGSPDGVHAGVLSAIRFAWSGVDLFFVLSGFLIGGILLDERDSPRYFQTFYARRAYRILPLYGMMLTAAALLSRPLHDPEHVWLFEPALPWWTYPTFTQNVAMAFAASFGGQWLGPTWSLAIEEQFYLVFPLAVWLTPRRFVPWMVVVVAGLAPLVRHALAWWFTHPEFAAYVLMPARADALMIGVLIALAVRHHQATPLLTRYRSQVYLAAVVLAAAIGLMAVAHEALMTPLITAWGYTVIAGFYGVALLLALPAGRDDAYRRALRAAPLRFTGRIAYALYLLHLPVLGLVAPFIANRLVSLATSLALTFAMATASWYLFESRLIARGSGHRY
jgi:peptidoglycan/LPS O-acetylase OafA/YrhL